MSLQLNSADVRLLVDGLKAWIEAPISSGLFSTMIKGLMAKDEDVEKLQGTIEERRTEAVKERDGRERQARSVLERLQTAGGPMQFTMAECLLMETGLTVWCAEATHQELITTTMKAMLFGRRVGEGMLEVMRNSEKLQQQRRLQVCPTQYKLVMAINAASEHEGVKV